MNEPTFLVTATHAGFLGRYREPGAVFEVTESQFTDRWMARGGKAGAAPAMDIAKKARQESLASGGASAALTTALADLRDSTEREALLTARVADLEARIAELTAQAVEPTSEPEATAPEPDAPAANAPVQRVRRTPAA